MRRNFSTFYVLALPLALLALVAGCLPFPVGDPAKSRTDPALEGYWLSEKGDQVSLVSLFPFDEHAYVLESRDLKRDGSSFQLQGRFLAKAWLTDVKGHRFLTTEPLAQKLASYKDPKFYPVLRLEREGSRMQTRAVSENFEPLKAATSGAELTAVVTREVENPALYVEDETTYRRLDPETDKDLIGTLLGEPR